MVHFDRLLFCDVCPPEIQVLVRPGNLLAIRRPYRIEFESLVSAGDRLFFAEAILRSDIDLIFAGAVGNVYDPTAVWRPVNFFLASAWRPGEIADTSLFRWDREHVTTCCEDGAFTVWCDIEVSNEFAYAVPMLHRLIAIGGQRDFEFLRFLSGEIVGVEITSVLEDD